jgi:hypothetical protein
LSPDLCLVLSAENHHQQTKLNRIRRNQKLHMSRQRLISKLELRDNQRRLLDHCSHLVKPFGEIVHSIFELLPSCIILNWFILFDYPRNSLHTFDPTVTALALTYVLSLFLLLWCAGACVVYFHYIRCLWLFSLSLYLVTLFFLFSFLFSLLLPLSLSSSIFFWQHLPYCCSFLDCSLPVNHFFFFCLLFLFSLYFFIFSFIWTIKSVNLYSPSNVLRVRVGEGVTLDYVHSYEKAKRNSKRIFYFHFTCPTIYIRIIN